jgi:hypothetical protein
MLAGLGLKAGDKRFKLPDIKTSDGKAAYAPSASKEKVAEKEAAAREALAAGKDPEEKKLDPSVGLVYSMAAIIVSANNQPGAQRQTGTLSTKSRNLNSLCLFCLFFFRHSSAFLASS